MAKLIQADGTTTTDETAIQQRLDRLGIHYTTWPQPTGARAQELLHRQRLDEREAEELLAAVDHRFQQLKRDLGYTTRDMVVIHEDIPGLSELLGKFDKVHYHTDDEVRYVLSGCGYFGFIEPDGGQILLEVNAGDYINIPANTEHWFEMRDSKRIKAVRYFIDTSGWTPVYTDKAILNFNYE